MGLDLAAAFLGLACFAEGFGEAFGNAHGFCPADALGVAALGVAAFGEGARDEALDFGLGASVEALGVFDAELLGVFGTEGPVGIFAVDEPAATFFDVAVCGDAGALNAEGNVADCGEATFRGGAELVLDLGVALAGACMGIEP